MSSKNARRDNALAPVTAASALAAAATRKRWSTAAVWRPARGAHARRSPAIGSLGDQTVSANQPQFYPAGAKA